MAGIKVTIDLDESQAIRALKSLEQQVDKTGKKVEKKTKGMDKSVSSFLGNLAAIATVRAFDFLRAQVTQAFASFQQFEQGLVDVTKTANLTSQETEELAANVKQLTREIPAGTEELLGIATAAGQLGVTGVKNITIFTDTVAKLGRVSDLQGEEAATTLTRILNVTRENIDTIDTFGSVIVSLGNNFAATESEIARVTNEVARATANFGVSSAEAAALSATLRAVGVRAEEAGGVLSKAFIKIDDAIRAGGGSLRQLEKITGLTGDQIKKQFSEDAIGLFRNFSAGLGRIAEEGGSVTTELAALDIKGIRVSKLLPVLAKNTSEFDRALKLARNEVSGVSNALEDEFKKGLESSISQTTLFENAVERARIRLGEKFAVALDVVLPSLTNFVDGLGDANAFYRNLAKDTDNIDKLNEQIKLLEKQLDGLADSPLPEFLQIDPKEQAANIQILKDRVQELNKEAASDNLNKLKNELAALQASLEQAKATPEAANLFLPLGREATEKRIAEIKAAIEAGRQEILVGAREEEAAKTQILKEGTAQRVTFLDELKAARRDAEIAAREEAKIAKEIEANEDFDFLVSALGKEKAAKELFRIKNIQDAGKRRKELLKLNELADKEQLAQDKRLAEEQKRLEAQKVQDRRNAINQIATLASSSNATLYELGKAAAISNAYINTSEAVTKTLAAFPAPINFGFASAVAAAGAAQIANILSAPRPKRVAGNNFQDGGIVGGSSFTGDRVQANLNSGEVVFNRRQQENLFNAVDSGNLGGGPSVTINNPMLLEQGAVDTLIDQINDALEFRNKELGAVS